MLTTANVSVCGWQRLSVYAATVGSSTFEQCTKYLTIIYRHFHKRNGNKHIVSMRISTVHESLQKRTHRFFVQLQFYVLQMLEDRFIVRLNTMKTTEQSEYASWQQNTNSFMLPLIRPFSSIHFASTVTGLSLNICKWLCNALPVF